MKVRDLNIGDWCIWKGKKYIRINGSFMSAHEAVFMGLDLNNFGRFYREDDFDAEVEFCPQWDYVNTNYHMSGKNCKSPYRVTSKLNEALDYFVLKDEKMGEIVMKRKYRKKELYVVIWSRSFYNQGLVFTINKYNGKRNVDEYIEYHLDFEGNDF